MSAAKQLKKLIEENNIDGAIRLCEDQIKESPNPDYYQFWKDRLTHGKSANSFPISGRTLKAVSKVTTSEPAIALSDVAGLLLDRFSYLAYSDVNSGQALIKSIDGLDAQRQALVKKLPYNGEIYLPTNKIPLSEQVKGLVDVHSMVSENNRKVTKLRFDELKKVIQSTGKRRVFVLGNGPSLKETDLNLLKDEITIGFNGIFLHDSFTPTIYVVEDHLVAEDRIQEITDYQCPVKIFPSYLRYCLPVQENTIFLNHLPRRSFPVDTDFSDDAGTISYTGGTVTYTGLQIAASLGFDEIYLVGVDASYKVENVDRSTDYGTGVLCSKDDDVNHFDSRYFGKGYRWHDPNVNTMLQAYRKVRNYASITGKKVRNATIGGQLEVFPRVNYYDLFEFSRVYPKVAILDFTHVDWLCATGIVKRNMFAGWAKHSLLHVHAQNPKTVSAFQSVPNDCYAAGADNTGVWAALRSVIEYNPDLLYLRPTADRPLLTVMQLALPAILGKPFVVHYMDDWLSKIEVTIGPNEAKAYRQIMAFLFKYSAKVLTISQKMSDYLEKAFSIEKSKLQVVHNYVQDTSRLILPKATDVKTIRYFGGLQPDMSLASVLEVATVVEQMNADGENIRFEIFTAPDHIKKFGADLLKFEHTKVFEQHSDYQVYLALLQNSDLNLLCYNFDEDSKRYLRYSMANKLPEIIGAGVPFLAIGSAEIGTITYLIQQQYPFLVTESNRESLAEVVKSVFEPAQEVAELYKQSLKALDEEFSKNMNCIAFQNELREILVLAGNDNQSDYYKEMSLMIENFIQVIGPKSREGVEQYMFLKALTKLNLGHKNEFLKLIKTHGISWHFKSIESKIEGMNPRLRAEDFAFFITSIKHERFASKSQTFLSNISEFDLSAPAKILKSD